MPVFLRSYGDRKEDASTESHIRSTARLPTRPTLASIALGELARRGSLDPHASIAGACQILARDPAGIVSTASATCLLLSNSFSQSTRHIHHGRIQTQNALKKNGIVNTARGIDCMYVFILDIYFSTSKKKDGAPQEPQVG